MAPDSVSAFLLHIRKLVGLKSVAGMLVLGPLDLLEEAEFRGTESSVGIPFFTVLWEEVSIGELRELPCGLGTCRGNCLHVSQQTPALFETNHSSGTPHRPLELTDYVSCLTIQEDWTLELGSSQDIPNVLEVPRTLSESSLAHLLSDK